MTTDGTQPVQPGATSTGVASTEGQTQPAPEPSQDQKLAEMIRQRVAEEVAKTTEAAKRELQSIKDKARAEVESAMKRARMAENTQYATRTSLQNLDPDAAKEVELAQLRAAEQSRMTWEQEEAARKAQQNFHDQFHVNLTQFITDLGVDPKDKRIDWADDAPNYLEAQRRILESASKIQKENIQSTQSALEKRLKDLEVKVTSVTTEANSVDTTISPGVVAGSDAEFLKKFGSGEIPADKENVARYNKIQKQYE